jgi:phosphocarrier protein
MLAAGKGSELELCAKGKDEREALEALSALVQERFGEAE